MDAAVGLARLAYRDVLLRAILVSCRSSSLCLWNICRWLWLLQEADLSPLLVAMVTRLLRRRASGLRTGGEANEACGFGSMGLRKFDGLA